MTLTAMRAMSYVDAGVKALTQWDPHWYREVDAEDLNICSLENCVVAQVFGDYLMGVNLLNGRDEYDGWVSGSEAAKWIWRHGFDIEGDLGDADMVNALWRTRVRALQRADQLIPA